MTQVSAKDIDQLNRELHAPGRVPDGYYRRNVVQYELVSYLTAIVALWNSQNYSMVAVFYSRAHSALARLRPRLHADYASFVERYLSTVVSFLRNVEDLPEAARARLDEVDSGSPWPPASR